MSSPADDRHAIAAAVILAGGMGTRLREAVPDLPKPMAPVNGRPFLEHQMDYWIAQGIRHFVLSVGYRHESISAHFGSAYRGVQVEYAVEQSPLGTGGGVLLAAGRLHGEGPFLLLNGDTYFEVELAALEEFHARHSADWTFSLFRTEDAQRYLGLSVDADGRIRSLRADAGASPRLANGGVYLVEPEILRAYGWRSGDRLSLEEDMLPALFSRGAKLYGRESSRRFIDIGVPEDYRRSAGILAS